MATFRTFRCKKCGHSIETDDSGHYYLMTGPYSTYLCTDCEEVVGIHDGDPLICPECNKPLHSTWNPGYGCPECQGKMALDTSGCIIMAD